MSPILNQELVFVSASLQSFVAVALFPDLEDRSYVERSERTISPKEKKKKGLVKGIEVSVGCPLTGNQPYKSAPMIGQSESVEQWTGELPPARDGPKT